MDCTETARQATGTVRRAMALRLAGTVGVQFEAWPPRYNDSKTTRGGQVILALVAPLWPLWPLSFDTLGKCGVASPLSNQIGLITAALGEAQDPFWPEHVDQGECPNHRHGRKPRLGPFFST